MSLKKTMEPTFDSIVINTTYNAMNAPGYPHNNVKSHI
jgi:hypothetical protein